MNIMKPDYVILTEISEGAVNELKHIEKIARKCYKSEGAITDDRTSADKMISKLIANHHEAMIEHSFLSVCFTVDRGVSHEMVRHRLASFAQESTRYCNYSKDKFGNSCNFIDLRGGIEVEQANKETPLTAEQIDLIMEEWLEAIGDAEIHYMKMLELGASPQIARSVLPNSTKTEIVITTNYREWRQIFKLRTAHTAHPQMREVMVELLKELQTRIPLIFDDIEM